MQFCLWFNLLTHSNSHHRNGNKQNISKISQRKMVQLQQIQAEDVLMVSCSSVLDFVFCEERAAVGKMINK